MRSILALGFLAIATTTWAQDAATASQLQAKATRLRYFERGWTATDFPFGDRWDVSQARTIGIMLDFEMPPVARRTGFSFTCQKITPSGKKLWDENVAVTVEQGWTSMTWTPGAYGWQVAGNWEVGKYGYECRSGKELIAQGSFEIVRNSELALDTVSAEAVGANVTQVRVFERGPNDNSFPFGSEWSASDARYLGVMLDFDMPPVERKVQLNYRCTHVGPNGNIVVEQMASAPLEPGWTRLTWTPGGWGWASGGHWAPGTYRVSCSSGGKQIASSSFRISPAVAAQPAKGSMMSAATVAAAPQAPEPEKKKGGFMRSVFGAGMGYAAAKASGANNDQTIAAVAKGVEIMNAGTAVGDAAAAVSNAYTAAAASAAPTASSSSPSAPAGPSSKGTTTPGSYPTKPNLAGPGCKGFTVENYERMALQGGNDTQLNTMCGQAFHYYKAYLAAIRLGYAEVDANRTYDAHEKSARVANQFYKDTRSTGGIRVP